jgi:hypothetical protein
MSEVRKLASQRQLIVRAKRRRLALEEYVRLASAIPSVARISLSDDFEADVFTHIDGRGTDEVFELICAAEQSAFDLIHDEAFEFHVVYMDGRPIEQGWGYGGIELYLRAKDLVTA